MPQENLPRREIIMSMAELQDNKEKREELERDFKKLYRSYALEYAASHGRAVGETLTYEGSTFTVVNIEVSFHPNLNDPTIGYTVKDSVGVEDYIPDYALI